MAPRAGYAALTLWLSPSVSKPSYEGGNGPVSEADARTRTGDPFITSEVLYQLSYVGGAGEV